MNSLRDLLNTAPFWKPILYILHCSCVALVKSNTSEYALNQQVGLSKNVNNAKIVTRSQHCGQNDLHHSVLLHLPFRVWLFACYKLKAYFVVLCWGNLQTVVFVIWILKFKSQYTVLYIQPCTTVQWWYSPVHLKCFDCTETRQKRRCAHLVSALVCQRRELFPTFSMVMQMHDSSEVICVFYRLD